MNDILDRLYSGAIYPAEQIVPADPKFRPTHKKISEEREYLKQKLSPEDAARLEEINDLYLDSVSMNCYAGFTYGFKLAVRLMCESFSEGEQAPTYPG